MSRRTARKHIFKIIFQMDFNKDEPIDAIIDTYNEEIEPIESSDMSFIKGETQGIANNIDTITATINNCANGWTLGRMNSVDAAILKIAVYEILFCEDIPDKVAANEAVELAKQYSADKAPGFINGILGKVIESKC